jgi:hypothetical protein
MGTLLVVINPPSFDRLNSLRQVLEPVLVKAFLSQSTIERLDERVIGGLARPTKVERHLVKVSPPIERLRDKLRAIIDANRLRLASVGLELLQHGHDVVSCEPLAEPDRQTLSRKVID